MCVTLIFNALFLVIVLDPPVWILGSASIYVPTDPHSSLMPFKADTEASWSNFLKQFQKDPFKALFFVPGDLDQIPQLSRKA